MENYIMINGIDKLKELEDYNIDYDLIITREDIVDFAENSPYSDLMRFQALTFQEVMFLTQICLFRDYYVMLKANWEQEKSE